MYENFPYRVRNRPLARLKHNSVHRSKSTGTVSQNIIKERLFSKHTVQSDSSKTMGNLFFFFDKFRLMALLLLLMMAQNSRKAKCKKSKNNNVEVQTFDAVDRFQPKNGTSHSLRFPAHTTQHKCVKIC